MGSRDTLNDNNDIDNHMISKKLLSNINALKEHYDGVTGYHKKHINTLIDLHSKRTLFGINTLNKESNNILSP